ncbi:MAG: hypothetical protein ACRC5T_06695, partial [Cetobacterium sp.]
EDQGRGIKVPGANCYVFSANLTTSSDIQSNGSKPLICDIYTTEFDEAQNLIPALEGVDYEIFTLEDYLLNKDAEHIKELEDKYQLENKYKRFISFHDLGLTPETKYTMPLIDNKKWSNAAIVIVMKKTVTNMYYILPRISFGAEDELLDIYMKNASFRMGDQLKEWEPALEQLLEPEVAMSYINITPDEIRLASKKISLGGGLVVEGPNVSVNQLSAKRLQLGDNFFFQAGGEQALDSAGEPLFYPDGTPEMTEEKLLIRKVNIGEIDAINPGIPNPNVTKPLDQFIAELDDVVSQKAEDRLNQEVELLDEVILKVEERSKDTMIRVSNISADGMVSGIEKIQLAKEIVDLESMSTILVAQVRGFNANHVLIDPPIDYQTLENDVKALRVYLTDVVKISETEVKNGYTYFTDTVVDNSVFNSLWDKAHQGYSNLMKDLQSELQKIADRADE